MLNSLCRYHKIFPMNFTFYSNRKSFHLQEIHSAPAPSRTSSSYVTKHIQHLFRSITSLVLWVVSRSVVKGIEVLGTLVTVLTVVDTIAAVVVVTAATEAVASSVTLLFLHPRPLVGCFLAFSCCSLAFSSLFLLSFAVKLLLFSASSQLVLFSFFLFLKVPFSLHFLFVLTMLNSHHL